MPEDPMYCRADAAAVVRSRSLPNSKCVTAPAVLWPTNELDVQLERTSRALSAVAAETPKTAELTHLMQGLADAILHDSLQMKSRAFHSGLEHGRWLNATEKDKFNLQYWELQRAYRWISDLQDKNAALISKVDVKTKDAGTQPSMGQVV